LEELCALERAVEKEWWWLAGVLHAVAEIGAEVPNTPVGRLRELHAQKLNLDRKRVEIATRIASIMGPERKARREGHRLSAHPDRAD
jgi:hypothetical protein